MRARWEKLGAVELNSTLFQMGVSVVVVVVVVVVIIVVIGDAVVVACGNVGGAFAI